MIASLSSSDRLHNMPTVLTPLIGRDRELGALERALQQGEHRLVTLTGPGGVGKTRLALELARRLAPDYPDGAWFVSLAAVTDPDLVASAIADALGLREHGGAGAINLVAGWLRARQLLLVLDNFEQLLGATNSVVALLGQANGIQIVVTSRAPLRIPGEREYPVAPLGVPTQSTWSDVHVLAANPAVTLFVDRAQGVQPEFVFDRTTARQVADICARLDGLPLAIELAAARLRTLPLSALAARLDRRLHLLAGDTRGASDRQRTLRTTIAWSHDLLSPADQTLFRRVAVFAGSFSLEAAAHVADLSEDAALDGLERLIDQSLIRRADTTGDVPRYTMLETIREFATEQLVFYEEDGEARERHADWYLALAEQLDSVVGSPAEVEVLRLFDHEKDNLRTALSWRLERGEREPRQYELGLRTAYGLWSYWDSRGPAGEARSWYAQFIDLCAEVDPALQASALWCAGYFSGPEGNLNASDEYLDAGLALALAIDDRRAIAKIRICRIRNHVLRGDYAAAIVEAETGLAICRALGIPIELGANLMMYGLALALSADYDRASTQVSEAIDVLTAAGDGLSLANALIARALVELETGEVSAARQAIDDAQQLGEKFSFHPQVAIAHWLWARMALAENDLVSARTHSVRAVTDAWSYGFKLSGFFETLAVVSSATGEQRLAARILGFSEALRTASGIGMMSLNQTRREQLVAAVRSALGDAIYADEFAAGRAMTAEAILAEEAVAYAARRATLPTQPVSDSRSDLLTPRELDVLREVVAGRTNREIAELLFITQRTAATHVTNILTKLNLDSRTAAAAWAVREGIV